MNIPEKLKSSMYICCLDRNTKTKIELRFLKEHFSIYFLEPIKQENLKEIRELFLPFISKNNRIIKISYIYIKTIYVDNCCLLKFTLYNPISMSILPIIFNHLKYKKSILFPESDLPPSMLSSIAININKKALAITEKKINDFIDIINLLYQFTGIERKYNEMIEEMFSKAFIFGKNYYDKNCKDFYINEKINRNFINEQTAIQINKIINEIKIKKENKNKTNLIEQIKKANKSSSSIEDDDDGEEKSNNQNMDIINKILVNNGTDNAEFNTAIFLALDIDSNNKRDLFQNYEKFKKFMPEIKIKTSYFSEITINLIFQILNINKNDLNNINNNMNKTEIGYRININNNKFKEQIYQASETNLVYSFKNKIIEHNEIYKENQDTLNHSNFYRKYLIDNKKVINENELLDFSKKFNAFLPNNSIQNIVDNTSQIIHRKFFELLFKHFFSDIIDIESEKNKAIDVNNFHQILRVVRRLKKILFTNKNIMYYTNYLFLKEQ
jgi:hypothetical protein